MKAMRTVFVSAVFSLERECEAIKNIIATKTGWLYIDGRRIVGSPLEGSYKRLEEANLYVGIFKKSSGSLVTSSYTYITELEYYRALNSGMPMLIYVIDQSEKLIDESLKQFLKIISSDLEAGICVKHCKNINELKNIFEQDLEEITKQLEKGFIKGTVPTILLENAIKRLSIFKDEAIFYNLNYLPSANKIFDKELVSSRIILMRKHFAQEDFPQAAAVGAGLIEIFLSSKGLYKNKERTYLWAEFLGMWAASCTWVNYIDGQFGALQAALMRKESYRILEDWFKFYESDGLISNCFYLQASKRQIAKSYDDSIDKKLENERERLKSLQYALVFAESCRTRIKKPFPHIYRAYINRELGNYSDSIQDFRRMVGYKHINNERNHLDYLINLGYALILQGNYQKTRADINEGLLIIKEAERELLRFFIAPHYLSFMKKVAQSYLLVGELEKGKDILDELLRIAAKRKLTHQAETINVLQSKITK